MSEPDIVEQVAALADWSRLLKDFNLPKDLDADGVVSALREMPVTRRRRFQRTLQISGRGTPRLKADGDVGGETVASVNTFWEAALRPPFPLQEGI
jgi:hypothetical protein